MWSWNLSNEPFSEATKVRWILEKRGKIGKHLCGVRKHLYRKNGFLDVCLNLRRDRIKEMLCQIENARLHLLQIENERLHLLQIENERLRQLHIKDYLYYTWNIECCLRQIKEDLQRPTNLVSPLDVKILGVRPWKAKHETKTLKLKGIGKKKNRLGINR